MSEATEQDRAFFREFWQLPNEDRVAELEEKVKSLKERLWKAEAKIEILDELQNSILCEMGR